MAYYPVDEISEAVEEYRRWGDELPPSQTLKDIFDPLEADEQRYLNTLLVKSHVCVDLARAEPLHAESWLARSEEALDEIEQREIAARTQAEPLPSNILSYVARAALWRIDLPNWRVALFGEGQPIENNYADLLEKASGVLSLDRSEATDANDTSPVNASLIEAVPCILGARKAYQGSAEGWRGRFALLREECRVSGVRRGYNPNWDTGVCLDDEPITFLYPSVALALFAQPCTGTRSNNPSAYRAAGVVPISAAHFGFKDPSPLILSCIEEAEHGGSLSRNVARKKSLMSSANIDNLTHSLRQKFMRSLGSQR